MFLLVGVVAAGLVFAAGKWNTQRLDRNAEDVLNQCYESAKAQPAELLIPSVTVCDENYPAALASIQSTDKWSRVSAIVIALLGALPLAWYFLLRRISELGAAFRGNRPAG